MTLSPGTWRSRQAGRSVQPMDRGEEGVGKKRVGAGKKNKISPRSLGLLGLVGYPFISASN